MHKEENEEVVEAVLEEATSKGYELKKILPKWQRRGFPLLPEADRLVRVDPTEDGTDGFFVACFVIKNAS